MQAAGGSKPTTTGFVPLRAWFSAACRLLPAASA
jgi:uncharacterized membrane protein YhdT